MLHNRIYIQLVWQSRNRLCKGLRNIQINDGEVCVIKINGLALAVIGDNDENVTVDIWTSQSFRILPFIYRHRLKLRHTNGSIQQFKYCRTMRFIIVFSCRLLSSIKLHLIVTKLHVKGHRYITAT